MRSIKHAQCKYFFSRQIERNALDFPILHSNAWLSASDSIWSGSKEREGAIEENWNIWKCHQKFHSFTLHFTPIIKICVLCVEIVRIWNSFIYDGRVKERNDCDREILLKRVPRKNQEVF
jgi:hypothetical protein